MDDQNQRDGRVNREVKKLGAASFLLEFSSEGKSNTRNQKAKEFHSRYLDSSSSFQFPQDSKGRLNRLSKRGGLPHDGQLVASTIGGVGTIDHGRVGGGVTSRGKGGIIFAESPLAPGVPVVYRTPEEKVINPDRLNLDRQHLTICPVLEGEEQLRLLNLQHNAITRLQHFGSLRRLVFLDLYDNLVTDMSGLEGLYSLRVLMLGRNRIHHISGLLSLTRLDVLDLHGNMIREILNLDHLLHLRVLNLAGNDITVLEGVSGLQSLSELNLRRNQITQCRATDIPSLQRLYLSHNLIENLGDISCLSACNALIDLSIDGNPLANSPNYRVLILSQFNQLTTLNQSPFTDEERADCLLLTQKEELLNREVSRKSLLMEERSTTLENVRKEWRESSGGIKKSFSYYIDKEEEGLSLYGVASLTNLLSSSVDVSTITSISIHYIDVTDFISIFLFPLKEKLVKLKAIMFGAVNLESLICLKLLADCLPVSVSSITIQHGEMNPVTQHTLYSEWITHLFTNVVVMNREDDNEREVLINKSNDFFEPLLKLGVLSDGFSCKKLRKESQLEQRLAGTFTDRLLHDTLNTYRKQQLFEKVWPGLINTLIDEALQWTYQVLDNS